MKNLHGPTWIQGVLAIGLGLGAAVGGVTHAAEKEKTAMGIEARTTSPGVADLEKAYGGPSQAGFGSAVFHDTLEAGEDLTRAALVRYRHFTGPLWERFGEAAWMGSWKEVYVRKPGAHAEIVAELGSIGDVAARQSMPLLLEVIEGGPAALSTVYDDPGVTELRVFNIGDGGAMSGLLVAGRHGAAGMATFVVLLMD